MFAATLPHCAGGGRGALLCTNRQRPATPASRSADDFFTPSTVRVQLRLAPQRRRDERPFCLLAVMDNGSEALCSGGSVGRGSAALSADGLLHHVEEVEGGGLRTPVQRTDVLRSPLFLRVDASLATVLHTERCQPAQPVRSSPSTQPTPLTPFPRADDHLRRLLLQRALRRRTSHPDLVEGEGACRPACGLTSASDDGRCSTRVQRATAGGGSGGLPAPQPRRGEAASRSQPARHIVRIIGRNAKQYKVLWNDPPDTWTLESISWLDSQEEHRAWVEEFRKRVQDAEVID